MQRSEPSHPVKRRKTTLCSETRTIFRRVGANWPCPANLKNYSETLLALSPQSSNTTKASDFSAFSPLTGTYATLEVSLFVCKCFRMTGGSFTQIVGKKRGTFFFCEFCVYLGCRIFYPVFNIIKIKTHSSCEIEYFVEIHLQSVAGYIFSKNLSFWTWSLAPTLRDSIKRKSGEPLS